MPLLEGGGFYTALFHISTSLVSYDASAWKGGFLRSPISYQHIFLRRKSFLLLLLTVLHPKIWGKPFLFLLIKEKFVPTSSSYSITSKIIGETIPTSSSYSITLWLKRCWTRTNNQPISHINYYFTVFLSSVPCCIGYILVLAWQAAEVAAESPTQASWTATRVLLKGLPC